jgi:hypothetical protein
MQRLAVASELNFLVTIICRFGIENVVILRTKYRDYDHVHSPYFRP